MWRFRQVVGGINWGSVLNRVGQGNVSITHKASHLVGDVAHVTDYTATDYTVTDYKPCSEPLHLLLEFRRTASWMTFSEVSRL